MNIEILNILKLPMKKIRGGKPIGVIIHIYIDYHKETPCIATFISNKLKCHVFHFIFYLFSSTKLENRRVKQVLPRREGWRQWEGRGDEERG
jgi:hypothetical protein